MKKCFTIIGLILCTLKINAQEENVKTLPISISIFNNGTQLPNDGYLRIFSKNIHPGISVGTSFPYRKGNYSAVFQTVKLGYFYHQYSQHALQLYSELGYGHVLGAGFYAQGLVGLGYLHSFVDLQQFSFVNGQYKESSKWGRPQAMASASVGIGYDLYSISRLPMSVLIQYQFWVQAPFVNKYVPVLPNSAVHLGVSFPIFYNKKKDLSIIN